ncbi:MAG: hypothetical protein R6V60_10795 [Desulfobacterales bacterium]
MYLNDIKIVGNAVIPEWWRKSGHTVSPEDVSDLIIGLTIVAVGTSLPELASSIIRKPFSNPRLLFRYAF